MCVLRILRHAPENMRKSGISHLVPLKWVSSGSIAKLKNVGNCSHFRGGKPKRYETGLDSKSPQRNSQKPLKHIVSIVGVWHITRWAAKAHLIIQIYSAYHRYRYGDASFIDRTHKKAASVPDMAGTTWKGLVKNTLVKHVKHGITRISGFGKKGISLYSLQGKRLCPKR